MKYHLIYICCLTSNAMEENTLEIPTERIKETMIDKNRKSFDCIPFYICEDGKIIWSLNSIDTEKKYTVNFGKTIIELKHVYFNQSACQFYSNNEEIIIDIDLNNDVFSKILLYNKDKTISINVLYTYTSDTNKNIEQKNISMEEVKINGHVLITPLTSVWRCLVCLPCLEKWRPKEYMTEYVLSLEKMQHDKEEVPYNEALYEEISKFSNGSLPPLERHMELRES